MSGFFNPQVELNFKNNRLHGPIPQTFATLTHMEMLNLDGNDQLTGPMPPGICSLKEDYHLEAVEVDCGRIQGCTCCTNCS